MRKLVVVLVVIVMGIALAGCGDKKSKKDVPQTSDTPTAGVSGTPVPTPTLRPPAPRNRPLPGGEPYDFEAPFSVGNFVRQKMDGRAVSAPTGGLQATYFDGINSIVLTAYRFDQADEAVKTVEFALASGSAVQTVTPLYAAPAVAFGVVQDRHGGHLAAWSHYEWCFLVSTPGSLDALNLFLDSFPY